MTSTMSASHQLLLLLLLPLVSAQNAAGSLTTTTTDGSKKITDTDLPEAYFMGTVSSEVTDVVPNHSRNESQLATISDLKEDKVTTISSPENTDRTSADESVTVVTIPVSDTLATSEQSLSDSPQIANSRSFLVDSEDSLFQDGNEEFASASSQRPEDVSTKPHKIKKKVLISRPKASTEKFILSTDKWEVSSGTKLNESKDLDASTESNSIQKISKIRTDGPARGSDSQTRSFRFPENSKSSSTERYDIQLTTSSLLLSNIQKLINNNLLNVIDTTVKPSAEESSESLKDSAPIRNAIKFDSDDFGSTGQSDWVPLITDKGSSDGWSPIASFSRTTIHPISAKPVPTSDLATTRRSPSTSMQTIVVIDSPSTPSSATALQEVVYNEATDMELPPGSASWALASSLFTRTENTTASPKRTHSPIIQALNDTLQRKIKENVLSLSALATTELSKSENVTKEHNQVLKNTIPDTVLVESTPSPWWRPIATTSASTRSSVKPPIPAEVMTSILRETTSSEEAYTDLTRTASFEIMKLTTSPSTRDFTQTADDATEVGETINMNFTEKLIFGSSENPVVNFVDTVTVATAMNNAETEELLTTVENLPGTTFYPTPNPLVVISSTTAKAEMTLSNTIVPLLVQPNTTEEAAVVKNTTIEAVVPTNSNKTTIIFPTTEETTTLKTTKLSTTAAAAIASIAAPVTTTTTEQVVTVPFTSTSPPVSSTKAAISSSDSSNIIPKFTTPKEPLIESTTPKLAPPSTSTTTAATTTTFRPSFETTTQKILLPPKIVPETTTENFVTTLIHTEAATVFGVEGVTSQEDDRTDDDNRTILSNGADITEDVSEENVPAYLRLTVQTSEIELCHRLPELHTAILKMLSEGTNTNVSAESIILLNLNPHLCKPVLRDARPEDADVRLRPVNMFLMDAEGGFNKNLSEAFLTLWGHAGLDFPLPILKVDFVTPIVGGDMGANVSSGVVAAIAISAVAGLCLILLGVLFVIMKRRQKKFNYGQRCTPVSLDAYSLDSVSIRNSGRRKNIRASKRSYGNAAFDDPEITSHILNFAGLANFSAEKDQIHEEFAVIPQVSPRVDEYPPGVETRNRYANVIPLPETRVVLAHRGGDPLSDYINANFVRGYNNMEKTYIAAQAPLESTLPDWWRMVWEQQVKVILMLTALTENGVDKCADYLPPSEVTDSIRMFGDFQVTLKKRDVKEKYIVSTVQLKNMETNLWREVIHLWYLGWPDSGVPSEPNSLIAFLIEARSQMKTSSGSPAPTLIHCSPGTGRTGTVIACDVCIREFEQNRVVDIPRCVYQLRRARAGAVQTRDQYAFIYLVLNTYATKLTGGALENI